MRTIPYFFLALMLAVSATAFAAEGLPFAEALSAQDAYEGQGDPVHMAVDVVGNPLTGWNVRVAGQVGVPAPAATLDLVVVAGAAVLFDPAERGLVLEAGDTFAETFTVAPAPAGATLEARFAYDAEWYSLRMQYEIILPQTGETKIRLRPLLVESGDPDAILPDYPGSVLPEPKVRPPQPTPGDGGVGALATTTISGTLYFKSHTGQTYLCRLCYIDIWDDDVGDGDDYLGATTTTFSGTYSKTVDNADCWLCGGVDVYFVAWTYTGAGYVVKPNSDTYWFTTPVLKSDCPDTTCNVGSHTMQTANDDGRAWLSYYGLALGWNEVRNGGPGVDMGAARLLVPDPDPDRAEAVISYTSVTIYLGANMVDLDAISHEHGHYAINHRLNPDGTNDLIIPGVCENHFMNTETDQPCAYEEGFAHYFALETQNDPTFSYPGGSSFNLEGRPCTGAPPCWPAGDDVEGRVASTFWDIVDNQVDGGSTENVDRSLTQVWNALRDDVNPNQSPGNFFAYYLNWMAKGYSGPEFRTVANWNTIPYT